MAVPADAFVNSGDAPVHDVYRHPVNHYSVVITPRQEERALLGEHKFHHYVTYNVPVKVIIEHVPLCVINSSPPI